MAHDFKGLILGAGITAITFFGIKELVEHIRGKDDDDFDDDFIVEDED